MVRYILGRAAQSVLCLLVLSVIIFFAARLTGNPLELLLPETATKEQEALIAASLGLDQPLPVQYGIFLKNALQGNLGMSLHSRIPVTELLILRVPASVQLASVAMVISLIIALPIGVYSAVRRGTRIDLVGRMFAILGQSMPAFWLGLMLMLVFSVWFGLVPTSGRTGPTSIILPAVTMGFAVSASIMRLTRSAMLDVLDCEYLKLARIKGLSEWIVIWKHAFKNALLPVVTYSVMMLALLIGGAVVTETVFSWPGLGQLVIQSVVLRDFPVVQGVVLVIGTFYVVGNFVVDILYAYLNPRIRYGR